MPGVLFLANENEVEGIDLPVGLGEDDVFRADIGGNDVLATPGEGGVDVEMDRPQLARANGRDVHSP